MDRRFRRADVLFAILAIGGLAALLVWPRPVRHGAAPAGSVRPGEHAMLCADRLRQLTAGMLLYVGSYGVFPPCDPFPLMRPGRPTDPRGKYDPAHGFILEHIGSEPAVSPATFRDLPESETGGPKRALFRYVEPDDLPEAAVCPGARTDLIFQSTPQTTDGRSQSPGLYYRYAACFTVNRLLRSPTGWDTSPRRFPPSPSEAGGRYAGGSDNIMGQAALALDLDGKTEYYGLQLTGPTEVHRTDRCAYLWDSRDFRHELRTVNGWGPWAGHWLGPEYTVDSHRVVLSGRHDGRANVAYVDGHVTADGQEPLPDSSESPAKNSTFVDLADWPTADRGRYWQVFNYPFEQPPE
jgi:prepilin-type processing-associated H-X9-DG protein